MVLVILYYSTYQNNTTFLSLFIVLYMYFAGVSIDAITFLNHFSCRKEVNYTRFDHMLLQE